jgi:uncharacterized membrane protein YvbJ
MGIQCEFCGQYTEDEDAIFCKDCGYRFEKTEIDVLKNIRVLFKRESEKNRNDAKLQTRVSYVSLIISIGAFFIALAAGLIVAFSPQEANQRMADIGIIVLSLMAFSYIVYKYGITINVDDIEK